MWKHDGLFTLVSDVISGQFLPEEIDELAIQIHQNARNPLKKK
jgi:hypothetical protein